MCWLLTSITALKPADIEFMKQLSSLVNVIPILAKGDTIPVSDFDHIRASITDDLANAELKLFTITPLNGRHPLYTVCSSPSKDLENMDASLLMQSDYIQPLQPSDLQQLIDQLLSKDTFQKLKYFAAKKIIHNRNEIRRTSVAPSPLRTSLSPAFPRSNTSPLLSESFSAVSQALISRSPGTITYNQATLADHKLREERLARVHLANWASNLQRSLQNERAKYEALAKTERVEWLKARLGECVFDADIEPIVDGKRKELALIPTNIRLRKQGPSRRGSDQLVQGPLVDSADPLRLIHLYDVLGSSGWMTLKVVSGCSVLGALVWWASRAWNLDGEPGLLSGWWERFE
jgi:hypothetical protein